MYYFIKALYAIKSYAVVGCILIVPLFFSFYITYFIVVFIEQKLEYVFLLYYPDFINQYLDISIPGIKLLVVFIFMVISGAIILHLVGRNILYIIYIIVDCIPVIRVVYKVIEKIFVITLDQEQPYFSKVVLIPYPNENTWAVGFITLETQEKFSNLLNTDVVAVFLPTAPSPFSGFIAYVPRRNITILNMTVEEAFALIISLGTLEPKSQILTKNKDAL